MGYIALILYILIAVLLFIMAIADIRSYDKHVVGSGIVIISALCCIIWPLSVPMVLAVSLWVNTSKNHRKR